MPTSILPESRQSDLDFSEFERVGWLSRVKQFIKTVQKKVGPGPIKSIKNPTLSIGSTVLHSAVLPLMLARFNQVSMHTKSARVEAINIPLCENTKTALQQQNNISYGSTKIGIKPAILDKLKKQQDNRFYNFKQCYILSKLNIAFVIGLKIHKQDFLPESANFWQLKDHVFERQFRENIEFYMQEH